MDHSVFLAFENLKKAGKAQKMEKQQKTVEGYWT